MRCLSPGRGKCKGNIWTVRPKDMPSLSSFAKNLELLDPPKQAQRGRTAATSSTGTNQQIPRKKRGREANMPIPSANQAWKKIAKYCMLHGRGRHTTNKC
eukprot:10520178-Ditylum_brightwellii.AAC.1